MIAIISDLYFKLPVTIPSLSLWLLTIFKYFQLSSQSQVTLVKNKGSFIFLELVCIILWLSDILSYRDTSVFLDSNWRAVLWSVFSMVTVTIYIYIFSYRLFVGVFIFILLNYLWVEYVMFSTHAPIFFWRIFKHVKSWNGI